MMVKKCVCFIDDSMLYDHRHTATGMPFTTFDVDNDKNSGNCAVFFEGGWWFNLGCHMAYLTGPWFSYSWVHPWYPQYRSGTNINGTSMLIKSS